MKSKEPEIAKKLSHPISVYSKDPNFVSSISVQDNLYTAELPAKALFIKIDLEVYEEIKYFWENYYAAILRYSGGEIVTGNLVIKANCTVDCEECF